MQCIIIPIAEMIPVIVFEENYNKQCNGKNIIKVKNSNEVYQFIEQMKSMKLDYKR